MPLSDGQGFHVQHGIVEDTRQLLEEQDIFVVEQVEEDVRISDIVLPMLLQESSLALTR